ncbi:MAG TPA: sigma 54-interacting transcriptional regulator [Polyangiaceae bacterium]|nr:sigma 54-interacting transcriptional regulator [Polyangiaceae bacterium]
MFVLEVVEGAERGLTLLLDGARPSRALVGQSESCELKLTDPRVSRRHAALEVIGERLRVSDLGSTDGTYVNGLPVGEAFLNGGETLRFGSALVRVARGSRGGAPELPAAVAFGRVVGASAEMRRLYPLCERLAASNVPVIIEGETGTGKEVLAESLHERGPLSQAPFVVFDCTAVPPNLVESELFGHERGAFTGAVGSRKGVFEQADGGTLLIDEIGDLDLSLQPKLLRAIERLEIRRVGGTRPIRVQVRVLAATRRDLDHAVQTGLFRDDLFHRLAVARIELPPLRARQGDVRPLALHFCRELGGDVHALGDELLRRWEDHDWPGNVRELRNAVSRHLALGELASHGAFAKHGRSEDLIERVLSMDLPLSQARERVVEEFERRYVERMLAKSEGVVSHAARASGVARRHFQRVRARRTK